jgi:hypothetical protein
VQKTAPEIAWDTQKAAPYQTNEEAFLRLLMLILGGIDV